MYHAVLDASRPTVFANLNLPDGSTVRVWTKGNGWGTYSDTRGRWAAMSPADYVSLDNIGFICNHSEPRHWFGRRQPREGQVLMLYHGMFSFLLSVGIIVNATP